MSMRKGKPPGEETVDVMISMRHSLLKRLDAHLERVSEGNRSAWVRMAIVNMMRREKADLDLEEV